MVKGLTVIDGVTGPVSHEYVVAPEAVKVTVAPMHIVCGDPASTGGVGFNVTTTSSVTVPQVFETESV